MTTYARRKLEAVAYHEAGHAVAACLFEIPFKSVTIVPDDCPDHLGRITLGCIAFNIEWPNWAVPGHPAFDRKRARDYVSQNVSMTLAGPLAQTLHSRCWQQPPGAEGDDEFFAIEVAGTLGLSHGDALRMVNRLRFAMLQSLQDPAIWSAVELVAKHLLQFRGITMRQAQAIVNRSVYVEEEFRDGHAKKRFRCAA